MVALNYSPSAQLLAAASGTELALWDSSTNAVTKFPVRAFDIRNLPSTPSTVCCSAVSIISLNSSNPWFAVYALILWTLMNCELSLCLNWQSGVDLFFGEVRDQISDIKLCYTFPYLITTLAHFSISFYCLKVSVCLIRLIPLHSDILENVVKNMTCSLPLSFLWLAGGWQHYQRSLECRRQQPGAGSGRWMHQHAECQWGSTVTAAGRSLRACGLHQLLTCKAGPFETIT